MHNIFAHYADLQEQHENEVNAPAITLPPEKPIKKANITAEELIENQQEDELLLLTNFTILEFNEIYEKVQDVIEHRIHSDSMLSGKTRLLMAMTYAKFDEPWRKFALNFGLNYSYAEKIVLETISKTKDILINYYIPWISVNDRITKFNLNHIDDYPALLGAV